MWSAIIGGGAFVLAIVFSLAKASSSAEKINEVHRKELLARKKGGNAQYDSHNKKQMKG